MSDLDSRLKKWDASVKCRTTLDAYELVKLLRSKAKELEDSLQEAITGIEWYRGMHPEDYSQADDEFDERIKKVLKN